MIEIRNNLNESDLDLIQSSPQKSILQDLSRLYIKKRGYSKPEYFAMEALS